MPTFRRFSALSLAAGIGSILTLAGCGGSGSSNLTTSKGNFSNASLNGSYVYQIHGAADTGQVYRQVGVFTADGNGNITGGTDDSSFNSAGTPITGTYSVGNDGTGFINLNTSSLGAAIQLAITMVSPQEVQLIDNDATLNAAGVAELQDPTAIGTAPSGPFVFGLHEEQAATNVNVEASVVGGFTFPAGTGAMDENLGGTLSSPNITVSSVAPAASGRGTASISDGTTLVYYIVNSGEFTLLVTNSGAVGSGSAEAQGAGASGGLSGTYAFGSRGDDANLDGLATVGEFTASNGSITGTEDTMQDGTYSNSVTLPTTCFTTGSANGQSGRVAVTNCQSNSATQVFWMVSSSRAFFLDNVFGQFQDGTADLQTVSSFTASSLNGQFVINMDGLDLSSGSPDLLSRVGTLQLNGSGNATLNELVNEFSGGQTPGALTGPYTVQSTGRTAVHVNGSNGQLDVVMYAVSGSQAYVMQQDAGLVTSGTVSQQSQ